MEYFHLIGGNWVLSENPPENIHSFKHIILYGDNLLPTGIGLIPAPNTELGYNIHKLSFNDVVRLNIPKADGTEMTSLFEVRTITPKGIHLARIGEELCCRAFTWHTFYNRYFLGVLGCKQYL